MNIHCRYIPLAHGILGDDKLQEDAMRGSVGRWGHSLAVRIPAAIAGQAGFKEGTPVSIRVADGCITISSARPQYSLEDLVAQMRPEGQHPEILSGSPVGAEVVE